MPIINPPTPPFVWRILSSLCLIQYIVTILVVLWIQDYPAPPPVPPPPVAISLTTVTVTPHCSTHRTKGTITPKRFQDELYGPHGAQAFLAILPVPTQYETGGSLAYLSNLKTYYDTGIIYCCDPQAFIDKTLHHSDADNTSYNEAITRPNKQEYKIVTYKLFPI